VGIGEAKTDSVCTIPGGSSVYYETAQITNDGKQLALYLGAYAGGASPHHMRRLVRSSIDPCVFDADTSFGEQTAEDGEYAVDDKGNAFTYQFFAEVKRFSPSKILCANSPTDISYVQLMAINPAGTLAFASYAPDSGPGTLFLRIDIAADSCSVTKLAMTGTTLTGGQGFFPKLSLAVDLKDRLHVADRADGRVAVFDRTGVFVKDYKTRKDGTPFSTIIGIAPCKGGLCVLDADTVTAFDEDGVPRAQRPTYPVVNGISVPLLTGSRNGGLFVAGATAAVDGGPDFPLFVASLAEF
jgi:hypothetical protein